MGKLSRRQRKRHKFKGTHYIPKPVSTGRTTLPNFPQKPSKLTRPDRLDMEPSAQLKFTEESKLADLRDSVIFAFSIIVVFVIIHYLDARTPFLLDVGHWLTSLLNLHF
jgi:hypothetical protein